jgi:hypothetical protein
MPGYEFCSCKTYGILKIFAICNGKNDEYPPVDITRLGLCFKKKFFTIKYQKKISINVLILLKIALGNTDL